MLYNVFKMAASVEAHDGAGSTAFDDRLCEIEATCVTGFEDIVKEDIEERLGVKVVPVQGKVFVHIPLKDASKISKLPSVDNLYVVVKRHEEFVYASDKEDAITQIKGIVPTIDWEFGLKVWSKFIKYDGTVSPLPQTQPVLQEGTGEPCPIPENMVENSDTENVRDAADGTQDKSEGSFVAVSVHSDSTDNPEKDSSPPAAKKQVMDASPTVTGCVPIVTKPVANPNMPAFRATCYRAGMNHSFQSPDVARNFGGAVQDYFGWNVKMKEFDIEVVVNVNETSLYVTLALTKESLHRRHLVEFGRCSLRPTIAYGMLRMCEIKSGDVVCDPMCGTGSIPIEAAVNWPESAVFCGDLQKSSVEKCKTNIEKVNERRKLKVSPLISVDVARWDATQLPLPDSHLDVMVTDMPFGKRSGSRTNNTSLYPQLLKEWARVSKPTTGTLCLLTQDRKAITKAMSRASVLWKLKMTKYINIGGIIAGVYLFARKASTNYKLEQQ